MFNVQYSGLFSCILSTLELHVLLYSAGFSPPNQPQKSGSTLQHVLDRSRYSIWNCTARQCSPLRRIFMECSIKNPALSLLMKHLVIGQPQKPPNFSAFHWSPHGSLVSIGQNFVTTRVVHFPQRTKTKFNYRIGPKRT